VAQEVPEGGLCQRLVPVQLSGARRPVLEQGVAVEGSAADERLLLRVGKQKAEPLAFGRQPHLAQALAELVAPEGSCPSQCFDEHRA